MCFKTSYPTQREAASELTKIRHRAKKRCPKRVYWCKECNAFHLTSIKTKPYFIHG